MIKNIKVATSASEQNTIKVINGKVTCADMKPPDGASVRIKGTDKGVSTNAEGLFRITMENDDEVLVILFTGYKMKK